MYSSYINTSFISAYDCNMRPIKRNTTKTLIKYIMRINKIYCIFNSFIAIDINNIIVNEIHKQLL
jgi:hypothetical protein